MKNSEEKTMEEAFEAAFSESTHLKFGFEDAVRYNRGFKLTHWRTVCDVHALGASARILELGAFTGVVAVALSKLGHREVASDFPFIAEDPALKNLCEKYGIPLVPQDLAKIDFPFESDSFDVIVFHSILAHLNFNPIPLVREFHRLLDHGGRVYCATPNLLAAKNVALILRRQGYLNPVESYLWNLNSGTGMRVGLTWREWTKAELVDLFGVCGFEKESHCFTVNTPNRSGFPRRQLVNFMYWCFPSLMPTQVGVFCKP
jgi:SAM-dependent methyltransferase